MEAVAAGATGYLQKYSGKERLLRAVRDVAEGEYRIRADTIRRVCAGIRAAAQLEKTPVKGGRITDYRGVDGQRLCPL